MIERMCITIKYLANSITVSRMMGAFAILFTDTFSIAFNVLYVFCGITDMIDGTIARKTHTDSKVGETLDSIADLIFMTICIIKVLPVVNSPLWLWIWVAIIVAIKGINLAWGYMYQNKQFFLHTIANKITGGLLFLTPLLLSFFQIKYIAIVVCTVATFAAIQEGYMIRKAVPKEEYQ